jgi:predicted nucleic acid-binding protein
MIILDTNVLSGAMASDPAVVAWLDRQSPSSVWTTAVTVFEIRVGLMAMSAGRRRTERERAFDDIIASDLEGRILPFDRAAAEQAARLMVDRHHAGRPRETRDTMIAGIALSQRASLATRNVRHFDDLDVPVLDPWSAEAR